MNKHIKALKKMQMKTNFKSINKKLPYEKIIEFYGIWKGITVLYSIVIVVILIYKPIDAIADSSTFYLALLMYVTSIIAMYRFRKNVKKMER